MSVIKTVLSGNSPGGRPRISGGRVTLKKYLERSDGASSFRGKRILSRSINRLTNNGLSTLHGISHVSVEQTERLCPAYTCRESASAIQAHVTATTNEKGCTVL